VIRGRPDKSGGRGFKPEDTREVAKTIPGLTIKEATLFVGASIDVGYIFDPIEGQSAGFAGAMPSIETLTTAKILDVSKETHARA